MKSQNVLATIFYPGAEKYIKSFLDSVNNQTFKDFNLVIFNNGMANPYDYLHNYNFRYKIINIYEKIATARVKLILYLLEKEYIKVIFSDADDVLDKNRVKLLVEYLDNYKIVVNDLSIIDKNEKIIIENYLSKRINNKEKIYPTNLINYNFMGFTNTAARLSVFNFNFKPKYNSIKAYDWFLWTKALIYNREAIFSSETKTYYRVYQKNVSLLNSNLNVDNVLSGINVKINHYNELSKIDSEYKILKNKFQSIKKNSENKQWLNSYLKTLERKKILFPFWWEKIILLN